MAQFATDSNERHGRIDGYMTTATVTGAKLTDEPVKTAFRQALGELEDILTDAAEMKTKCENLKGELSKVLKLSHPLRAWAILTTAVRPDTVWGRN